jgi:hypothetical protein
MPKFAIKTRVEENYAAHNEDWDGKAEYWKNKSGSTYIVEASSIKEAKTVIPLVTDTEDNLVHMEILVDISPVSDDYESEFMKNQKEYDPKGWDTLYCDRQVRKGKSSNDWYMKRGYIVGGFQKGTEHEHLIGKFVGNVDNLSTNTCVLKIDGDNKTVLNSSLN